MDILFEDEHFAIVAKKIGDDSQLFFKEYFHMKKYAEVVNRLDKPVSGLVIIAFSKNIHKKLTELFQNKKIEKEYWAICKKDTNYTVNKKILIENNILFHTKKQKASICENNKQGKKASLYLELAGNGDNYNFFRIYPITGRTHQIRIQLANLGIPIKGDIKYGADRTEKSGGIRLHAYSIKLKHPFTHEEINCSIIPPEQDTLWQLCTQICSQSQ